MTEKQTNDLRSLVGALASNLRRQTINLEKLTDKLIEICETSAAAANSGQKEIQ